MTTTFLSNFEYRELPFSQSHEEYKGLGICSLVALANIYNDSWFIDKYKILTYKETGTLPEEDSLILNEYNGQMIYTDIKCEPVSREYLLNLIEGERNENEAELCLIGRKIDDMNYHRCLIICTKEHYYYIDPALPKSFKFNNLSDFISHVLNKIQISFINCILDNREVKVFTKDELKHLL